MNRSWQDTALDGIDPDVAAQYQNPKLVAYLDRALEGVSEDAKIEALRVMVNLGIAPNDEVNIIVALLGRFRDLGIAIPQGMREVVSEMDDRLNGFVEATELFNETARALMVEVIAQIRAESLSSGKSAVQSASIEENDKYRTRLLITQKEVMGDVVTSVRKEMEALATARITMRMKLMTALVYVVLLLVGTGIGYLGGQAGAHATAIVEREAANYQNMWNDPSMPSDVRAWWERWAKTH